MDLYLIRHTHAVDGEGRRDDDRPLSAKGRGDALDVGHALQRQGVTLGRLVTSPLVRAVETAELIAVSLGFSDGLEVHDALRPDGSWKQLLREVLEPHVEGPPLALVGHEPSIGHFLSKLMHEKGLSLQKGGVARLSFAGADEPARLVFSLSPKRLDPSPAL
jgi:phosphohistidine phosphatase